MCTLTFSPHSNGFVVTQNRDESPLRGTPIFPFRNTELKSLYPKDPDGDGTWMLTNGEYVICVLNGGYELHERKLPYRHSRGLLPSIALQNEPVGLTLQDAQGLEPFSVFIFSAKEVTRYTWNATDLFVESFAPSENHIFQSAPLYSPAMQETRELWWDEWIADHPQLSADEILAFHRSGGDGAGETNICMYRPGVQTTSISQVQIETGKSASYYYFNVLDGSETTVHL